jgi:hypothetical protein
VQIAKAKAVQWSALMSRGGLTPDPELERARAKVPVTTWYARQAQPTPASELLV